MNCCDLNIHRYGSSKHKPSDDGISAKSFTISYMYIGIAAAALKNSKLDLADVLNTLVSSIIVYDSLLVIQD